jgi:hypothetical protein
MMNLFKAFVLTLCVGALAACEKNAVQDITGPLPSARVKFYNFGVNAPAVNFFANETKMTAITSTTGAESAVGVGYGGVAAGDRYVAIAPGQHTFSGRISALVDKDLPISTVAATIADGKHYSFYQSGIYNSPAKTIDSFLVEDNFPAAIDWSVSLVRLVHAISNAGSLALFAVNTETGVETPIGGAVAYRSAGAFTPLTPGLYDIRARYPGATANVIVRTGVGFAPGRVYTIGARGDITVTSTTAATRPFLDVTINRQG